MQSTIVLMNDDPMSVSYGLNRMLFPYSTTAANDAAVWGACSATRRLRRTAELEVATDTNDERVENDPDSTRPALPELTYVAPGTACAVGRNCTKTILYVRTPPRRGEPAVR